MGRPGQTRLDNDDLDMEIGTGQDEAVRLGYWQVSEKDAARLDPDTFRSIRDRLREAADQGDRLVVVEGITLHWVDATPPPAAPPLDVERLTVAFRNLGLRSPRDFAIQTEAEYARLTDQEDGDG